MFNIISRQEIANQSYVEIFILPQTGWVKQKQRPTNAGVNVGFFKKTDIDTPHDPAAPLLGICRKNCILL